MKDKSIIYPHRAYKKLNLNKAVLIRDFLILIFFWILFVLFGDRIIKVVVYTTEDILKKVYSSGSIEYHKLIIWNIPFIKDYGLLPSKELSILVLVVSIAGIFVFLKIPRAKGISIFIAFALFILAVSSAYFLIMPERFPYDLAKFSQIYIDTLFISWISIGILCILSVVFLPFSLFSKLFFFGTVYVLLIATGILRYAFIFVVIKEYSHIFTPLLFFIFGTVVDFLIFLSIYGIYISLFLKQSRKDIENWRWIE